LTDVAKNIQALSATLPPDVKLVAVSKTKPVDLIQQAYDAGQRCFGENKAQELADKFPQLPNDIEWHFIGHLQTNKVKYIAPFVHTVHSIDSLKLLSEVNKRAQQNERTIHCLLQFHIADESTKFGLNLEEAQELLASAGFAALQNIRITGVMGMATFTDNQAQVTQEFSRLKSIFDSLKTSHFASDEAFSNISMGMSGDYELAIAAGSNLIRVGSALFGARNIT